MDEISKGIDTRKLKGFVRHVCVIAKKQQDREKAHIEMQKQMQRLKKFTSKKKEMDEELKELNRKVSLVLEKEAQLLGIEKGDSALSNELMKGVSENKQKIDYMSDSINSLKESLDNYVHFKMERERKIDALEKKIRTKAKKKEGVSVLKKKLNTLESMYDNLKKKGVDVSQVEGRIQYLKLKLAA